MTHQAKVKSNGEAIKRTKLFFVGTFSILIIIVIIFCLWFLFFVKQNSDTAKQQEKQSRKVLLAEDDKNSQQYVEAIRARGDYEDYQATVGFYISGYLDEKEYDKAKITLDRITTKVPEDRLTHETYKYLSRYYRETGDQDNYIKATEKLIESLKRAGFNEDAKYFQAQLKDEEG